MAIVLQGVCPVGCRKVKLRFKTNRYGLESSRLISSDL